MRMTLSTTYGEISLCNKFHGIILLGFKKYRGGVASYYLAGHARATVVKFTTVARARSRGTEGWTPFSIKGHALEILAITSL